MQRLPALLITITSFLIQFPSIAQQTTQVDICIYGGNAAGVIAAYTAQKLGSKVLLVEPGSNLGGLTAGGLGNTDIGNKYAITGLARDFYRRIGAHYNKFEQWVFEPHVAGSILHNYIQKAKVTVWYNRSLIHLHKSGTTIQSIEVAGMNAFGDISTAAQTITAKVFIDCSYEGDLMAKAGVSYTVGREPDTKYDETYNGVQLLDKHQFPDGIDPYIIPGDPSSGLLWGISKDSLSANGTGDKKVQAYNFRLCLTDSFENQIPITRPEVYDPAHYELLLRYISKANPKKLEDHILNINRMPGRKTDINNNGPFSTDMIGMNYNYADADMKTRKNIIAAHIAYTKGLLYFLGHDDRVPEHLRNEMLRWGYPKDEYQSNNHFTPQLYIREARRMVGAYIMTQANCQGKLRVTDTAGLAAYTMDSHNCERLIVNGMVKNEGDVQIGGFGPYPVSYRSLTPKQNECTNLLVPVCLSASHIAYGSIRMEPVFMVLAQTSATAAAMAIKANTSVQAIDIKKMRQGLRNNPLADGSPAEILVDNDDSLHIKISGNWQRITEGGYGPSFLKHDDQSAKADIKFYPDLSISTQYNVYAYFPVEQSASTIPVTIFDGTKKRRWQINIKDLTTEGQASGEWIKLGSFNFSANKKIYVEISNDGAGGPIAADAILFIPQRKP